MSTMVCTIYFLCICYYNSPALCPEGWITVKDTTSQAKDYSCPTNYYVGNQIKEICEK